MLGLRWIYSGLAGCSEDPCVRRGPRHDAPDFEHFKRRLRDLWKPDVGHPEDAALREVVGTGSVPIILRHAPAHEPAKEWKRILPHAVEPCPAGVVERRREPRPPRATPPELRE